MAARGGNPIREYTVQPLTKEDFAPFGAVIEPDSSVVEPTPGSHNWYGCLGVEDSTCATSVNILEILWRPFVLGTLECHKKTTETIIPLSGKGIIVTAAPAGSFDADAVRSFYVPGGKSVSFAKGVWHFVPHGLEQKQQCVVVFRKDTGKDDMHFHKLDSPIALKLP